MVTPRYWPTGRPSRSTDSGTTGRQPSNGATLSTSGGCPSHPGDSNRVDSGRTVAVCHRRRTNGRRPSTHNSRLYTGLILAEFIAEHVANLLHRGVGFDRLDGRRQDVLTAGCRVGHCSERRLDGLGVAVDLHRLQSVDLSSLVVFVDGFELHLRLVVDFELVDPDDDPLAVLDLLLARIRDVLDLLLDVAGVDRSEHPAAVVDRVDDFSGLLLHVVGQRLDVVAPRQRVDSVGRARLVGEDLLGSEGGPNRLLSGEGERLVLAVR